MTHIFLSNLKSTLDNCITELDEIHSMFCRNPESDFTRNRKLSFREYIQFMLQMQSKSVSNEILDFFEHSLFLLLLNPPLLSNDTSFCLRDGISCSTHLSISVAPYRIISIMVTDFWPAMALMLTYLVTRRMKEPSSMKAKGATMQSISMHCMISPIISTVISLCRGKRNFMNALHLTQ